MSEGISNITSDGHTVKEGQIVHIDAHQTGMVNFSPKDGWIVHNPISDLLHSVDVCFYSKPKKAE